MRKNICYRYILLFFGWAIIRITVQIVCLCVEYTDQIFPINLFLFGTSGWAIIRISVQIVCLCAEYTDQNFSCQFIFVRHLLIILLCHLWISTSFGHGPAVMSTKAKEYISVWFSVCLKGFLLLIKNYKRISLDFRLLRNLAKNVRNKQKFATSLKNNNFFFLWRLGGRYCVFLFNCK